MENIDAPRTRPSFFLNSKRPQAQKAKEAIKNEMIPLKLKAEIPSGGHGKANAAVSISEAIKDFARIKKAVDNAPILDNSEKIAHLKKQIQNNQYKVDYEGLADKILQSEF